VRQHWERDGPASAPGTERRSPRDSPFLRPVPGLANAPARYPRLGAVGYYLSPFGLCALSHLPRAATWGSRSDWPTADQSIV